MRRWFSGLLRLLALICAFVGAALPFLAALGEGYPTLIGGSFLILAASVGLCFLHSLYQSHHILDRTYDFVRELFRAPYVWMVSLWVGGLFAAAFMGLGWLLAGLQEQTIWGLGAVANGSTPSVSGANGAITAEVSFPWREQAVGAFGAMLTGISMVVVVGSFYRRLAPFTDLWELIDEIECDIEEQRKRSGDKLKVWWAYPGFALGRYRSLNEDGSPGSDDERYTRFQVTLRSLLSAPSIQVEAIVYDHDCLNVFYGAYHLQGIMRPAKGQVRDLTDPAQMSNEIETALSDPRVMECVSEEKALLGAARALNKKVYATHSPEAIPTFVIVIGSVVYQIANYGSPIYMDVNPASQLAPACRTVGGVFFPSDGRGDHLLKLVAFRRHDRAYAETVAKHLSQHATAALALGAVSR